MSGNYGMIGLPRAKVMVKFERLAGMIPSDADADHHVSALGGVNGQFAGNYKGLKFDAEGECFYRDVIWANRNNYLFQRGATIPESELLYEDSDVALETGRRTWIPIMRPGQINAIEGPNAFLSPADFATSEASYPSNYDGPRWSINKAPAQNTGSTQKGVIPQAQWIAMKKTKPGVEWAIRQSEPNFTNQPFWIHFKKEHSIDPPSAPVTGNGNVDTGAIEDIFDPEEGSWLMIVLGGWSTNRDPTNSLSIVFPIGGYPYMIDNNVWIRNLAALGDSRGDKNLRAEALSRAQVSRMSSEDWILTNENNSFQLTFMVMRNRLFIRSSFANSSWIFPDRQTENVQTGGHVRSDILAADRASSDGDGLLIPAIPIEIHGKGFGCSFNFNPMEFQQGPAFVIMPPITYSDASTGPYAQYGGMDQVLTPWFSDEPATRTGGSGLSRQELDESPFAVPSGDPRKKAYGVDFNPNTGITTHGLGTDCIDWQVEPGFPRNFYGAEIEVAPGVTERGTSETAKLMSVTRFRVNLISKKGTYARKGFETKSSAAYRTPFFYRMKLKVRTNFVNKNPGTDISTNVLSIAHSTTQQNKSIICKEITLTCTMPKTSSDSELERYAITDRESLTDDFSWGKLSRIPAIVRIWMGLDGSPDVPTELKADFSGPEGCYFTGVTQPKSMELSAARDTCTIQCVELTKLLENQFYTSSPFFDGMAVPYAIAHVLERGGWSAMASIPSGAMYQVTPEAIQVGVMTRTLPDSGRFTQPIIKFSPGTPLMNCIKSFIERFQLVFRTDNTGRFLLDVPPGSVQLSDSENPSGDIRFTPTNDLSAPEKFHFTSFPNNYNIHNQLKGKKVISPKNNAWHNVISIQTEDRFTGSMFVVQDGDPESIVNPNAINFMGYMRQQFSRKSALGGKAEARNLINKMRAVLFQPIMMCTFTIPGRKDLKPLDLVQVDNNVYRVLDIRGTMTIAPNPGWTMDVSAECIGYYKSDPDTSAAI